MRRTLSFALALLALASLGSPASSAPTREELRRARSKVQAWEQRVELLVERYNQTKLSLDEIQGLVAELRGQQKRAQSRAVDAQDRINEAAAGAYRDGNSAFVQMLTSPSLSVLSERLEFLDLLARIQTDAATRAEVASEEARSLQEDLKAAESRQRIALRQLRGQKSTIERRLSQQRALVERLEEKLRKEIVVKPPPPPRQEQGSFKLPPIDGEGAEAAINAARSVVGVRYTYAGDDPNEGFDCSGLTMWAWRHGGVSMPHSSQAQYDAYPHVRRSQLVPGDLLFFYEPISHVGLYVGGGQMIHASSSNDRVVKAAVYWEHFTGAARPR